MPMLTSLSWLLIAINYQHASSYIFNNLCDCTISVNQASPAYNTGTSKTGNDGTYISTTNDSLGPWNGQSIHFQGTNNGNFIIYEYQISCNIPCWITSITVEGVAFWHPNLFTLYPSDSSTILNEKNLTGGNTFQSHILDISNNEHYSKTFYLTESNNVCCWRYRSLLNMTMIPGSTTLPNNNCGCSISVISVASIWNITTTHNGFKSTSIDPLGPWYGQSVQFKGRKDNGGDVEVYDYQITCIRSCSITNVNIQGAAWQNSEFTLYGEPEWNILGTMDVNADNVLRSFDLDMTQSKAYYAKRFRFIETNTATTWRYRSSITLTMNPEPTSNPTAIPTPSPTDTPTTIPTSSPTTATSSPTEGTPAPTTDTPSPTSITVAPSSVTTPPTADAASPTSVIPASTAYTPSPITAKPTDSSISASSTTRPTETLMIGINNNDDHIDDNMSNEVPETTDITARDLNGDISNNNMATSTLIYIIGGAAGGIILLSWLSCLVCLATTYHFTKKKANVNDLTLQNVASTDSIMNMNDSGSLKTPNSMIMDLNMTATPMETDGDSTNNTNNKANTNEFDDEESDDDEYDEMYKPHTATSGAIDGEKKENALNINDLTLEKVVSTESMINMNELGNNTNNEVNANGSDSDGEYNDIDDDEIYTI